MLDEMPDGMVVVLDSPRQLLMNGVGFGCGWKSSRISSTPVWDRSKAHEQRRSIEDDIRAMTGVSSLKFLREDTVSRLNYQSVIGEFVADALSEKGAIARRVVSVVTVYLAQKRVVTGFCIAPGSIYDARLPELIRLAGAARPVELDRHKKDD